MAGDQKIKIKINGEEKDYNEEIVIHDWKAKREVAATTEEKAVPLLKDRLKKKPNPATTKLKKKKGNPAVVIAIISAIAIGVLIGIILLQMMVKESNQKGQGGQPAPASGTASTGEEETVLPAVSLYILQQGVYQNKSSVEVILEDYQKKNLPASSINNGENIRIFVAVTDTLETGKEMRGTEFYQKTFKDTWPTKLDMNEKVIQHLTKEEKQFLESAYPFYETLVKESANVYLQGSSNLNMEELTKRQKKLKEFSNLQKGPIKELQQSLVGASEAMTVYLQEGSNKNWQNLQKYLLEFVSRYYLL